MTSDRTSLCLRLALPPERIRLVRLCRHLTGDDAAAEDLAQEALVEAWRHLEDLRRPELLSSWLAGIAANVCRRWHRRQAAEGGRKVALDEATGHSSASDMERMMERREIAALLDRAMGHLSPRDREILVARYHEERSLAEIASRGGWALNTAAVRLGRSRKALHTILTTRLRKDAAAFGLIEPATAEWEQTRLWCFRCGRRRLEGRFNASDSQLESPEAESEGETRFAVRCPQCDAASGDVAFSSAHAAMDAARVLGPVRGYKPAFRRVNGWWAARIERGLREGVWDCWRCSGPMALLPAHGPGRTGSAGWHQLRFQCRRCDAEFSLPASGVAFHSAAGQRFWQRCPRMRVAPERTVLHSGRRAVVVRYEDVTGTAALEIVYAADTLQPLQIWGDVPSGTGT